MIDPDEIRKIPRFANLGLEEMQWLSDKALLRHYKLGEPIFFEGDECTHCLIIIQGEAKVFKVLESGREIILGIIQSGEAIGEVSLLDGTHLPANAMAHKDCTVFALEREVYHKLLKKYPAVVHSIIRDLTLRMRSLRIRVETLSEQGVQSRISQLLQSFSREIGRSTSGSVMVPVRLSRGEIAGMVGARIETVIRIMSRWQKEGIVETLDNGFLIKEPAKLAEMVGQGD